MNKLIYRSALALAVATALVGCDQKASLDPTQQSGSDPGCVKTQTRLRTCAAYVNSGSSLSTSGLKTNLHALF
jgi:hypothetical protein